MNSIRTWLKDFLGRNATKLEVALLLFSFFSLLIFYLDISNLFLVISLNLAGIFYFFIAFDLFEDSNKVSYLANKVTRIGSSLTILGTLLKLQNYHGHDMILRIGVLSMSIAVLVYMLNSRRNWSNNLIALVVRISLIATLGLILWLL